MTAAPFDLNPRHLRALSVIIGRGSMSAAAEAVGLSQPALTQGIAKIEQRLRTLLFERHAEGTTPTAEGRLLAERSDAAIAHLAQAVRGGGRGFARPELLMTGTQLRAFLALADAGGFARAAEATGLSQPALHRAAREIEQICGYPLVERRGRGVALTAAGTRLARGVRLARAELAAAIAEIEGNAAAQGGSLTIGAMPLSRALILPRAIARFTREYPRVRIDVVEGSWRELIDPLLDGVLDLTIGALREHPPRGARQLPLLVDRLAVIARSGHPLAREPAPTLARLAAYPWIVGQAGTPLRNHWEKLFEGHALPPAPIECGSVMVIREVLRESDFLTLLSPDQIALEAATGILTAIGPSLPHSSRTIGITLRENWRPTTAQTRFMELLRSVSAIPENQ
ncbi:LysR family transcriptional regulator [Sphingomonas psychrotolerans]|uniref:LysR family transcriptional regulator n=1 Tax=Sphingomonas psychrotolerans TaxID=1327635 RepID=A0ABU3N1P3_9SPHN|nr:LysR family transcriptional regulator [Sphingomonas psychrotolerans]MDT8758407.1 LysR family transcriptional regulator [Sphingomonas psychrotolerans]